MYEYLIMRTRIVVGRQRGWKPAEEASRGSPIYNGLLSESHAPGRSTSNSSERGGPAAGGAIPPHSVCKQSKATVKHWRGTVVNELVAWRLPGWEQNQKERNEQANTAEQTRKEEAAHRGSDAPAPGVEATGSVHDACGGSESDGYPIRHAGSDATRGQRCNLTGSSTAMMVFQRNRSLCLYECQ